MKDIFFIPGDWDVDPDAHSTVAVLKPLPGYNKKQVHGWQLGDWQYSWSTIACDFNLTAGEEYCFYFWLNGGENDRHDEVCELEIFGEDWNARQTFSLNRNHTKPQKYLGGWYLFAIPFTAKDDCVTMRFNAQRAIVSLVPATITDLELVAHVPSDTEDSSSLKRSNIVYSHPESFCIRLGSKEYKIPYRNLVIAITAVCFLYTLHFIRRRKRARKH